MSVGVIFKSNVSHLQYESMENQVGSINFDANHLYLEEDESEGEYDDKRQDNEIRDLISQGGLDGFLDDDSLMNSSAESSYEQSDSENRENEHKQRDFKNAPSMPLQASTNMIAAPQVAFVAPQMINNENIHATPAHNTQMKSHLNKNYLIKEFNNPHSTPANNQNPPPPQLLQATVIPKVAEEKLFYRQRNANQQSPSTSLETQQAQVQFQTPIIIKNAAENEEAMMMKNDQIEYNNVADMTAAHLVDDEMNKQNFLHLQEQHYISHSKLHSMDRFNVAPASSQLQPHAHNHLTNEHELNETDNEEENNIKLGNGVGISLGKTIDQQQTITENQQLIKYKEQSLIDLNELDEAQLKQLQAEEEKQQQEYFNIDSLNRMYCQAQFLYKVRGKKLEEVTNRFTAYQEDMSREMRAMKHRLNLAEKEKESLQISLDQAHDLCTKYKAESELSKKTCLEVQEKIEQLKQTNRKLEQKLLDNEQEIDNLHLQINEQQKLDTLERVQQQHEHYIQQLRDQYENDLFQFKEKFGESQRELNDKHELINLLKVQLETASKNAEMAIVERADTINRLTKSLNDLQAKYDQDILLVLNKPKSNSVDDERLKLIDELNAKCQMLQEQLKLQAMNNNSNNSDFHLANLSNSLNNSHNQSEVTNTLQRELERALNTIKQKRNEIQTYQSEIEQLKLDMNTLRLSKSNEDEAPNVASNSNSNSSDEMNRLNALIDELQRERVDLNNDLMEKNKKIDELLEQEEQFQQLKQNFEIDLFNKQQHIQECEHLIQQLSQNQDNQLMIGQYESQMAELQLKLTNKEHEIQKVREMYIEVCKDKNNLQDTLKEQYDSEYEIKLKHQLNLAIADKLDEQKNSLMEKWSKEKSVLIDDYKRKLDTNLIELKSLKEQLIQMELQCNNLKLEKANLEAKSVRTESELKEKCLNLEVQLKDNEEKARTQRNQTENELNEARKQIEQLKVNLESNMSQSQSNLTDLKHQLQEKVDQLQLQNEQYSTKITELNALIQMETANKFEYEKQIESLRSQLNEKDSSQNSAFQIELNQAQVRLEQCLNELTLTKEKLGETESLLKKNENQLAESQLRYESQLSALQINKQDEIEHLKKQTHIEVNQLKEKLKTQHNELERLSQTNQQLNRQLVEQNEKLEVNMKHWQHEKSTILSSKEEELQKIIVELEKRFEDDYGKFMDTHKEAMQRTLNEKSVEFSKEKEKLIELYQTKYNEYETNEQSLLKQIKELKEKMANLALSPPQSKPVTNSCACQTESDANVDELLTRINDLEQLLTNTDAHFELELNKLRQELEEEYQIKLKSELESEELTRKQLEEEMDNLKYLLDKKYAQDSYENEMSMKNAFESKEMQLEQEFRIKLEQMESDFEEHLRKLKMRHEDDLLKQKQELNDGYKQALSKSKSDIEQAQLLIKRLKKSNQDSDKVIESLKIELNKVKENHLNELTTLKMSTEREKEQLKENYEKAMNKIALLEKQLDEGEERMKKQCDLLREELKAEYGSELTRMNTKMKDMAKAHTNAIDALKKHHQYNSRLSSASSHNSESQMSACQTDLTYKDVELLEAFRQKYLNTLTQLKSDLIREFDAQTMRVSQTYTRQLKEERSIVKEKLFAILLPKVAMVLREFRVLESVIASKLNEFEKDVVNIVSMSTATTNTESSSSATSPSSSSANRTPSSASSSSAIAAAAAVVAKRSLSALSNTNKHDSLIERLKTTSNLYSKSVSSMRNINGSNTSLTSNSENKANSEIDLKESDAHNSNNNNNNSYTRQLNVSTGYKYTPLRQSWSNLSQMNQLSPYSSSSSNHENPKKTLFDEKSEKSSDNSVHSRPMTADSISSRSNFASKLKTQPNQDEFIEEKEEDYVYFDDEKEAIDSVDFNKRYRTQNIRYKRTSRTAQLLKDNEKMYERPRSAHNLIVESINTNTTNAKLTRSSTNLHSDSMTALSTTTKRNLDDILQPKTTLSIYSNKTGRMLADSSVTSDQTDHTPIRLSSENVHQNPSTRLLTNSTMKTATTVTSNPVTTSSAVTAFTSSSLPRSRTPTNTNGANNHYKSATISSVNKSVQPTQSESATTTPINLISISNNSIQHQSSVSSASTQYHTISSNIASNLVKNSAFQKKKPVFY